MNFNPVTASINDLVSLSEEEMINVVSGLQDDGQAEGQMALLNLLSSGIGSNNSDTADRVNKFLECFIRSQCRKENYNFAIIKFCMEHTDYRVRLVQLNELRKLCEDGYTIDSKIVPLIVRCLEVEETIVGTSALELLSVVLLHDSNSSNVDEMKRLLICSSTIRCRVYEIVVDLSKKSLGMLCIWDCILERMIAELDSDDILMQMSIFELMISLCDVTDGFNYLKSKKVFEKIAARIDNRLDAFSHSQLLKFLCGVAAKHPAGIIVDHPDVVQTVFQCIESDRSGDLNAGLQSFGNLADSAEGKLLLNSRYPVEMRKTLQTISSSLGNYPSDLKRLAFMCLCHIFSTENADRTPEIIHITKLWHEQFWNSHDFSGLLRFIRMPFGDIKEPALLLLGVLITYEWGISAVQHTPCLIEYLLDRSCERDKNILQEKYAIIQQLADSNHIDSEISAQLQKYVNEGPFYVKAITEIAYEES